MTLASGGPKCLQTGFKSQISLVVVLHREVHDGKHKPAGCSPHMEERNIVLDHFIKYLGESRGNQHIIRQFFSREKYTNYETSNNEINLMLLHADTRLIYLRALG